MDPWYRVVTLRKEVREGRSFSPDEFAIALEQVVAGTAPQDYSDPAQFFSRTCFTRALTEHSGMVLRRLSSRTENTAPILTLITQFGGGKTHTLASLYHLANAGPKAGELPGVPELLQEAGIAEAPEARVGVFVGNAWDPSEGRETPWIDLARQIAGDAGVAVLGDAARTTPPGTEALARVFAEANAPVLLLFDEVLNFVNRHRGLADSFHAFLQNLTVATTGVTRVAGVISLPRSQVAMTEWDQEWQDRITKVVRRVARNLIANDESEISEVVRHRLFESLGSDRVRQNVARAYADWCFERSARLPSEWTAVDTAATGSRGRDFLRKRRERPGLVPSALFHIIGNTVFLRLADVASGLPPYEEQVMLSSMDSEEDATGYSQRSAYNTVYEELRLKLAEALKAGSKRLLATYLQTLLAYPDGCTRGETVFDPRSGDVIVQVPPLSEEKLYPKEKALIDMVAAERMEGRRVLVYATHTGTRDITERMDDMLTRHGFRVAVMKADAVAPERREAWVADRVKEGIDVMICHPRLVQTRLDLIDFPTLIWYGTDYSVYVMRQASRRSWRIGQTRPVKVVFMSYRNTLQADALKLVAKKLQSSLAVEGELPEDGLAAYGDDGDDLMMALARKIVSGDEEEDETVEAVFAQARDAEAASEEFLVDDGWKVVEVEPKAVEVNGNGTNGHHANGIGPTVELVLANGHHANGIGTGHAAAPVNGNGHHDEAPEPQQSLFSWAEFMAEEPVKPKGRGRKPQPAATSLFEWALEMEQEREEEPVGAGR